MSYKLPREASVCDLFKNWKPSVEKFKELLWKINPQLIFGTSIKQETGEYLKGRFFNHAFGQRLEEISLKQ